jgi:anti-sigma B factor antagonist
MSADRGKSQNGVRPDEPIARVERTADETTVVLVGDLDFWTVREVGRTLDGECDHKPRRMTLDLGGVEFVDSAALHLFVRVDRRLKDDGCALQLHAPSPHVRRVLEITGLDTLIAST